MEQPKARLTLQQHQQAINEAIWIDASPHEWPTVDKMWLLCSALVDSVQMVDYLRSRLAAVEAKRDAARAEVAHMKREQQAMIMQHRHDIRDLGELLQDERCKVATLEAKRDRALAGEARAVEALRAVVAGAYPHEEETWTMEGAALRHVHRVLDRYKPTLDNQPSALDWLDQQRAEAAAEALEEFADDADGIEELITCNIFDLRSALRTRAAGLRAGEVGDE